MRINLNEVAPWARLAQDLFNAYKDAVVDYDPELEDPWEDDTLEPAIVAVENMILTDGLKEMSADDTATLREFLKDEIPLLTDLDFALKKCIKAGTVEDAYGSFMIGPMRAAISKNDMKAFHTAFTTGMTYINANAVELKNKGFTSLKKTAFKSNHDNAYDMQTAKSELKVAIGDLKGSNKVIVDTCMNLVMFMITSIFAYAKSNSDKDLMKRATGAALLRAVRPTPAKKPRNKYINATETIIYQRNIAANRTMQFTVKTSEALKLGRSLTITGTPKATMDLPVDVKISVKKNDIPGEGEFIKIINSHFTKAKVLVFIVNPKKKKK